MAAQADATQADAAQTVDTGVDSTQPVAAQATGAQHKSAHTQDVPSVDATSRDANPDAAKQTDAAHPDATQTSTPQANAAQPNATQSTDVLSGTTSTNAIAGGLLAPGDPAARAAALAGRPDPSPAGATGADKLRAELSRSGPRSSTVDDRGPGRQPVHLKNETAVTPGAPLSAAAPPVLGSVDGSVVVAAGPAPSVAQQVSRRLIPLRKAPDGTHRLTIRLNPDGLGPISVVAEVRKGAIAVQITGGTEAGRAALQATLPDLRRDLVEAGFGSCSLDLQQNAPQPGQQGSGQANHEGRRDRRAHHHVAEPVRTTAPGEDQPGTHRALDLRV